MEYAKVIYARNTDLSSFAIRLFTWSKWHHVGAVMPDGKTVIESRFHGGVVTTDIDDFKSRYKEYRVAYLPVLDRRDHFSFLRSQLGKNYDKTAIISLALRRDWQETDSWFCSELIAKASGIYRHDSIKRITPEDLWRISKDEVKQ